MQGFNTQALRLQMGLSRQNSMLYDVYNALRRRREATQSMKLEVTNLKYKGHGQAKVEYLRDYVDPKGIKSAAPSVTFSSVFSTHLLNETAAIRITLQKKGTEVLLFKGQWIRTPMGDGQILSIQPGEGKITLQLSFGKLYANISRAVCWGQIGSSPHTPHDLTSDSSLRQRWVALHSSGSLCISQEASRGIQELVGMGSEDSLTDNDDDSANDESFPSNTADDDNAGEDLMKIIEISPQIYPISSDLTSKIADTCSSQTASKEKSVTVPVPVTVPVEDVQTHSHGMSVCFPLKGCSSSLPLSPATMAASASSSSSAPSKSLLSREALRHFLTSSSGSHQDGSVLPLVFAPPGICSYA